MAVQQQFLTAADYMLENEKLRKQITYLENQCGGLADNLRDQMAIAAMQGLLAAWGEHDVTDFSEIAADAYNMADALLKERERGE